MAWIFFLELVDPSWNRLASTAYFAIISSVFCMHDYVFMLGGGRILSPGGVSRGRDFPRREFYAGEEFSGGGEFFVQFGG